MATGVPLSVPTQSPAAAGTLPLHPLISARVPVPSGTEAGALTRTCVPTGNCMLQGVPQVVPFTVTVRPASELVTVRDPTGLYVATIRMPVSAALAGTVK